MLFPPTFVRISVGHDPKIWASFLYTTTHQSTVALPSLKGRYFLFSFLHCWRTYKQHCCVMYPVIITVSQYCRYALLSLHAELNFGMAKC